MSYDMLILIHLISTLLMLGVGGGSAFYKFMGDRSNNIDVIVHTNKTIVFADWIFTTPSAIVQPISGVLLILETGYSLNESWLLISIFLYVFAGVLWLIAVHLQLKMKCLSIDAQKEGNTLGDDYFKMVKQWIILGIFSFLAVAVIFYLMIMKPIFY